MPLSLRTKKGAEMNFGTFASIFLAGAYWERATITHEKKYYFFSVVFGILTAIFRTYE